MLTNKKVEQYSEKSHLIADDYKTRWTEYRLDAEAKVRRKESICKTCWYILRPKSGGRVPTRTHCELCDCVIVSPTTATDKLCEKCAKDYQLCKECGADLNYVATKE